MCVERVKAVFPSFHLGRVLFFGPVPVGHITMSYLSFVVVHMHVALLCYCTSSKGSLLIARPYEDRSD
jgi:hypothetical protein